MTELCNTLYTSLSSVREAQQVNAPTIGELLESHMEDYRKIFIKILKRTIQYFGINPETDTSVSNEQIIDLFTRFSYTHRYWTLADIIMCFNRVKESPNQYGKFFGRVDASVIMGWFCKYEEEMQAVKESLPATPAYKPGPNDISEDVYMDSLLAMAAGGDEAASRQYHYALETRRMIARSNGLLAVYRYNRNQRFNEERRDAWQR